MPVGLVPVRIEIAAPNQQAAPVAVFTGLGQRKRIDQPINPVSRLPGEALGHLGLQLAQLRIDVVEVDEDRAFHESGAPPCQPTERSPIRAIVSPGALPAVVLSKGSDCPALPRTNRTASAHMAPPALVHVLRRQHGIGLSDLRSLPFALPVDSVNQGPDKMSVAPQSPNRRLMLSMRSTAAYPEAAPPGASPRTTCSAGLAG